MAITMGIEVVNSLAARVPGVPWVMRTSTLVAISSYKVWEPLVNPVRPAKLNNNVRALNVAEFAETRA